MPWIFCQPLQSQAFERLIDFFMSQGCFPCFFVGKDEEKTQRGCTWLWLMQEQPPKKTVENVFMVNFKSKNGRYF